MAANQGFDLDMFDNVKTSKPKAAPPVKAASSVATSLMLGLAVSITLNVALAVGCGILYMQSGNPLLQIAKEMRQNSKQSVLRSPLDAIAKAKLIDATAEETFMESLRYQNDPCAWNTHLQIKNLGASVLTEVNVQYRAMREGRPVADYLSNSEVRIKGGCNPNELVNVSALVLCHDLRGSPSNMHKLENGAKLQVSIDGNNWVDVNVVKLRDKGNRETQRRDDTNSQMLGGAMLKPR